MSDHDDLRQLLQSALPPVDDRPPPADLWRRVVDRRAPPAAWTWLDLGAVAAAALLSALFPGSLWLLLFHL